MPAPFVVTCLGPAQIRAAYGIQSLLAQGFDGSGETIAIVVPYGSPTISSDLHAFDQLFGLPDPALSVTTLPVVDAPDASGDAASGQAETSLDVEWAHVVAPGAKIALVVAGSDSIPDIVGATNWAVDNSAGDVLSLSFGLAESCIGSYGRLCMRRSSPQRPRGSRSSPHPVTSARRRSRATG